MEHITYQEQLFWGASLDMASIDEINLCYKYLKAETQKNSNYFTDCINAQSTKRSWMCGNSTKKYPLCSDQNSILMEHLIEIINHMVKAKLNINCTKILDTLKSAGYVQVYPCDRVFFVK